MSLFRPPLPVKRYYRPSVLQPAHRYRGWSTDFTPFIGFHIFAIRNLRETFSTKETLFTSVADFEYFKGQLDWWKDGASIPDDRVRYTNPLCLVSAYPIVRPTLPNFGVTMALCLADR